MSFFTIANYNVMGTSGATDEGNKMFNSSMGVSAIYYGFEEKYEALPIIIIILIYALNATFFFFAARRVLL